MQLWTIQTWEAWQVLQTAGRISGRREYIEPLFLQAYDWMIGQMEARLGQRPCKAATPVWAWYQWSGEDRPKPDLRHFRYNSPPDKYVRLEIELPAEQVLLSDFSLWHYVINYWYLPISEADAERFDAELEAKGITSKPYPEPFHSKCIETWSRIFDLTWCSEYVTHKIAAKRIQATFWELCLQDVKKVQVFESVINSRSG